MSYIAMALAALVAVVLFLLRRSDYGNSLAKQAADQGDIAVLLDKAAELPEQRRSTFYQNAIQYLWRNWQRPLAIRLIKAYAFEFSEERICQYWLRQALEIEPSVARMNFDDEFLRTYYQPEVAKTCVATGCSR